MSAPSCNKFLAAIKEKLIISDRTNSELVKKIKQNCGILIPKASETQEEAI